MKTDLILASTMIPTLPVTVILAVTLTVVSTLTSTMTSTMTSTTTDAYLIHQNRLFDIVAEYFISTNPN